MKAVQINKLGERSILEWNNNVEISSTAANEVTIKPKSLSWQEASGVPLAALG